MNTSSHEFVTVDMRGLKAALVARAQADRVSMSVLVRGAVARELGIASESTALSQNDAVPTASSAACVKLSIRMTTEEARQLAAGARAAGLSRGAYLVGLTASVPVLAAGGGRAEHVTALMASNAEMATLSRNLHRLTVLLGQADAEAARQYRTLLDSLAGDIRRHLALAAGALADLQPRGRGTASSGRASR